MLSKELIIHLINNPINRKPERTDNPGRQVTRESKSWSSPLNDHDQSVWGGTQKLVLFYLITLCPLTPLRGVSKSELVRMISFRFKRTGERELDLVWKKRRGWMTNIFDVMLVNHSSWPQGFGGAQAGGCDDWFYCRLQ
jgi:hypothetical protein